MPVPASTSQTNAAASSANAPSTSTTSSKQQSQADQSRDMKQSTNGNHLAVPAATSSSKGAAANEQYQREAERIVAEEREASEKMPYYEGLSERFQLIKKMGDGAFSNVYKARDRQTGQKVAIKVVRKYELNSNQVSRHMTWSGPRFLVSFRVSCSGSCCSRRGCSSVPFPVLVLVLVPFRSCDDCR